MGGMFFQDGLTGSAWGDWAMYEASPLRAFESELGVQAPVGFWDPLGFCKNCDEATFKRRRQVELKHGRVCMLATIGYMAPEYFRFPGFLSTSSALKFSDVPNGLAALSKMPLGGGLQWFFFMGALERGLLQQDPSRAPGDFQNIGNLGVPYSEDIPDPEARKRSLNAEIANGRLAMVAIMGMMFQDGTFGTTGPEMWLPGSAFESELGAMRPMGFWDPLGFCKDGDADDFYRRRCTEIKHGRVSMIACIGYIVPEYFRFPGYCSPSDALKFESIKFSDVPNGLGAFSKVPVFGWLQIVAFCGFIENTGFFQGKQSIGWGKDASMTMGKGEPGNYGLGWIGAFNKIKPIPELRQRKLNAELANGRLAMTAIMAMLFQNGTVGSTGPEMWSVQVPEYGNTVGDFVPKNV